MENATQARSLGRAIARDRRGNFRAGAGMAKMAVESVLEQHLRGELRDSDIATEAAVTAALKLAIVRVDQVMAECDHISGRPARWAPLTDSYPRVNMPRSPGEIKEGERHTEERLERRWARAVWMGE